MKLKDLLPKSAFGTIATIVDESSLDKLQLFLNYNRDVVSEFKHIILSINVMDGVSEEIVEEYIQQWQQIHSNVKIIRADRNRGHMLGTIDLEEAILKYLKETKLGVKYLWKSMDDVLIGPEILDVKVESVEFYYLPSISFETLEKNLPVVPQTTFYIIDITKIDTLYGNDVETKWTAYIQTKTANSALKPWEMKFDIKFDCETHLYRTVKNLTNYNLIRMDLDKLIKHITDYKIGDPSHKNIYFDSLGICHYHFYNQSVFNI